MGSPTVPMLLGAGNAGSRSFWSAAGLRWRTARLPDGLVEPVESGRRDDDRLCIFLNLCMCRSVPSPVTTSLPPTMTTYADVGRKPQCVVGAGWSDHRITDRSPVSLRRLGGCPDCSSRE